MQKNKTEIKKSEVLEYSGNCSKSLKKEIDDFKSLFF